MKNAYQFQAEPKQIVPNYMQSFNIKIYRNLMSESKVIRGNTHSKNFKFSQTMDKTQPLKKSHQMQKKSKENQSTNLLKTIKKIQKNSFVNDNVLLYSHSLSNEKEQKLELVCKGIYVDHETRMKTNLNPMLDKAIMTEFDLPEKILDLKWEFPYGIDKQLQVVESEIFDFDKEVESLVEVLKSRILEDSRIEVQQEEDLKTLSQIQNNFKKKLQDDKHKKKLLIQEKEKNKLEKLKIRDSQKKITQIKIQTHKKLMVRNFAKQYMKPLEDDFWSTVKIYQKGDDFQKMQICEKFINFSNFAIKSKCKQIQIHGKQLVSLVNDVQLSFTKDHKQVVDFKHQQDKKQKVEEEIAREIAIKERAERKFNKRVNLRKQKVEKLRGIFYNKLVSQMIIDNQNITIYPMRQISKEDEQQIGEGNFIIDGIFFEIENYFNWLQQTKNFNEEQFSNRVKEYLLILQGNQMRGVIYYEENLLDILQENEIQIEEISLQALREVENQEKLESVILTYLKSTNQEMFKIIFNLILVNNIDCFKFIPYQPNQQKKANMFIIGVEQKQEDIYSQDSLKNEDIIQEQKLWEIENLEELWDASNSRGDYQYKFQKTVNLSITQNYYILDTSLQNYLNEIFIRLIEGDLDEEELQEIEELRNQKLSDKVNAFIQDDKQQYSKFEFLILDPNVKS